MSSQRRRAVHRSRALMEVDQARGGAVRCDRLVLFRAQASWISAGELRIARSSGAYVRATILILHFFISFLSPNLLLLSY